MTHRKPGKARKALEQHAGKATERLNYQVIDNDSKLPDFLSAIGDSDIVGFDTEFVAEDCYQPDLCLLQFSTREKNFILDPKQVGDLSAVWNLLTDGMRTVIVHAGREEILFAYRATGKLLPKMFDIQVAVGFLGGEYPASYGKLLQKYLNLIVPKGETRTDWRKRPLSKAQLEYAAIDVEHLPELFDLLTEQLLATGRLQWLEDELLRRQLALQDYSEQEGWFRISGVQSLRGKQLGIVRELWKWRESRAKQKNMPPRRVLRDDLIIELAKRAFTDTKQISHIRGLHHSGFQRFLPELAERVRVGSKSSVPKTPWESKSKRVRTPALLQQFLNAAMAFLCRTNSIAPTIVGTSDDVGRLASYWIRGVELSEDSADFPNLLRGWRRDFVGDPLRDIFLGKRALRVEDPTLEMPLALCDIEND